ncbi:MAG: NapC/NirT family cytochrome c [Acidobacteria bacterium]|nr:NapC/NirT family cytochrome c [Acidobacteriota bacterium]
MTLRSWITPFLFFSNNVVSLTGVVLVTIATVTWLLFLPVTLRGGITHPYFGIIVYLLLPCIFGLGLVMIPLGIYWRRRKQRISQTLLGDFPLDLRNPNLRRLTMFVLVTTFVNIVIASQFTYSAIDYMDSVSFCGQTCHTVMQPEFTAYQVSPHARVECVSCHIGAGASWFLRSKITGVGQVFAVMLHNYPKPIPTPVRNLRPAKETCETCHWSQHFADDRLVDIPTYAEDEQNTLTHTVLLLHVGGGQSRLGIHGRHLGEGVRVRYYPSDDRRQNIPWVEYTAAGETSVFVTAGTPQPDPSKVRVMDCMDCHNRPTHVFQSPERALDQGFVAGQISSTLPFAKKWALEVLKKNYSSQSEAARNIPAVFESYYQNNYPKLYEQSHKDVLRAAEQILAIYKRNVFPQMNITWGTYPNNIGHTEFTGCFRCHDEQHARNDGKTITQDCTACHSMVAVDEKQPKILTDLGVEQGKQP